MENTSKTGNRPPAFQFYPDKWQSHTRRLSDTAYRVYHEIICWMWLHSPDFCSIPSNSEAISCIIAISCERVSEAMIEIQNKHAPLLRVEGDKLVSNGLRKSHLALQDRRNKAVMAINTRWNKAKQTKYKRNTDVKIEKYTPSPSPTPSPTLFPIPTQEKQTCPQAGESAQKVKPERPRNPHMDALGSLDGALNDTSKTAWGRVAKALSEIREVSPDVTPDEIKRRADNYVAHFNGAALTSTALAKHWAKCGVSPESAKPKLPKLKQCDEMNMYPEQQAEYYRTGVKKYKHESTAPRKQYVLVKTPDGTTVSQEVEQ